MVFELQSTNAVSMHPMMSKCTLTFWEPYYDLEAVIPVATQLKLPYPDLGCTLSLGSACVLAYLHYAASFDLKPVTLTFEFS